MGQGDQSSEAGVARLYVGMYALIEGQMYSLSGAEQRRVGVRSIVKSDI